MGKAVICSRVPGQTDVVVEGENGRYVPVGDPSALAAGQQEMSAIDRLRAQFEAATYLFEMTGEAQFNGFDTQPVSKVGGGIVSIGTALVAVDRLGTFYEVQPAGKVRKLEVPHLPNNLEAYAAANGPIGPDYFRVYSAVYLKASHELAVSHEVFDVEHKGTRMGVSLIGFDPATLKTLGTWRTIFRGEFEAIGPNVAGGGRMVFHASP
jgi:hypothetical protein